MYQLSSPLSPHHFHLDADNRAQRPARLTRAVSLGWHLCCGRYAVLHYGITLTAATC